MGEIMFFGWKYIRHNVEDNVYDKLNAWPIE